MDILNKSKQLKEGIDKISIMKKNKPTYVLLYIFIGLIAIIGFNQNSFSQEVAGYNFTYTAGTYTSIAGGATLTPLSDDASFQVSFPFDFVFNNIKYTTADHVHIYTNGFITFGGTAHAATNVYNPLSNAGLYGVAISAIGMDLKPATSPEIMYKNTGGVFTIQWKNFTRWFVTDVFSFQIKLYETSNKIEIIYNLTTVDSPLSDYPEVGLRGAGTDSHASHTTGSLCNTTCKINNRSTTTSWATTTPRLFVETGPVYNWAADNATCKLTNAVKPVSGATFAWTPNGNVCTTGNVLPLVINTSIINGTVYSATADATSPYLHVCQGTEEEDVWYSFTTTYAGSYTITVNGSEDAGFVNPMNPVIELRSDCSTHDALACAGNNIRPAGGIQSITYTCAANTTYYIRIWEYTTAYQFTSTTDPKFTITVGNGGLPIELGSFSAKCNDKENNIKLKWSTSSETNNDYFTIEKSSDLINYTIIGNIDGAGNSNNILEYEFTDESSSSEVVYYRLKQADYDGNYEYFGPIAVACNNQDNDLINVYPNPANDFIIVSNLPDNTERVELTDLLGNLLLSDSNVVENKIEFKSLNLAKGLYLLKIESDFQTYIRKVLIN